jgi:hypothetical protein
MFDFLISLNNQKGKGRKSLNSSPYTAKETGKRDDDNIVMIEASFFRHKLGLKDRLQSGTEEKRKVLGILGVWEK